MKLTHHQLCPYALRAVANAAQANGLDAEVTTSKRGTPYVRITGEAQDYSVCWFYGTKRRPGRGLRVYWPFPSFGHEQDTHWVPAPKMLCYEGGEKALDKMACKVIEFILTNPNQPSENPA